MKDTGCPISKETSLKEFYIDFKQENVIESSYYSIFANGVGPDITLLTKDEHLHNQIISNCSIENLACDKDKCLWDEIKIITPRQNSLLNQFRSFNYFQKSYSSHNSINTFLKDTNRKCRITKDLSYKNSRDIDDTDAHCNDRLNLILNDILVTVVVFKPLPNQAVEFSSWNMIKNLKPEMRIDLLGNQTLEDLLNTIRCKNGESLMGDFSEFMDNWTDYKVSAKDGYKGGFFFIENTFYDCEDSADLSTPIINWVSKSSERIEQFGLLSKKSIKNVRLIDMKVCIGKPYLYQHMGNCEHLFVFSDVKLINKHHCQDPARYPIVTGTCRYAPTKCLFCDTANSEWLTMDCKITPTDKTPMCDYCLRMSLYDENYKKIEDAGDFKVLKFPSFL